MFARMESMSYVRVLYIELSIILLLAYVLRLMIIIMRKELPTSLLSWLHCAMKMPSTKHIYTLLKNFYRTLTKGLLLATLLIHAYVF